MPGPTDIVRERFPWELPVLAAACWAVLAGASWVAAKAVLLSFAHAYAHEEFPHVVPWLILIQMAGYAWLLWRLRWIFRHQGAPRLWQIYAAIFLSISVPMTCFGVLGHHAAHEVAPASARQMAPPPTASLFPGPALPAEDSPPGLAALPPPEATPRPRADAEQPYRPSSAWRRLGFFCRKLAEDGRRLHLLIAMLILPCGMILNHDLLASRLRDGRRAWHVAALTVLPAMVPAWTCGWLAGFIVGWATWAIIVNTAVVMADRHPLER